MIQKLYAVKKPDGTWMRIADAVQVFNTTIDAKLHASNWTGLNNRQMNSKGWTFPEVKIVEVANELS